MRTGLHPRSVVLCLAFGLASLGLAAQAVSSGLRPTMPLTEGPYYKQGSPEQGDLAVGGVIGARMTITGTVYDLKGVPLPGAWLDFWQADGNGRYDNTGYRLRGHQLTDAAGRYILKTVVPGKYPGRTPHIHVKLRAPGGKILTTQIFFPGKAGNTSDRIFDESLVIAAAPDGKSGRIDFVIAGP